MSKVEMSIFKVVRFLVMMTIISSEGKRNSLVRDGEKESKIMEGVKNWLSVRIRREEKKADTSFLRTQNLKHERERDRE